MPHVVNLDLTAADFRQHPAMEFATPHWLLGAIYGRPLLQAKLPLALPVVMLGLNQTIMAALSMLAIAALVGTRDLGQAVYVALGKADAGMGLIAGLSIAFLAILADRLIQAAVARSAAASR